MTTTTTFRLSFYATEHGKLKIFSNPGPAQPLTLSEEEACRQLLVFPELLQALKDLLADCPYSDLLLDDGECECGDYEDHGECVHSKAAHLIAKAEGR